MATQARPNITRYEHNHFVGWRVCVKRRGQRHTRYVSDTEHGGRTGSLRVARRVRDELLLELPPELRTKARYGPNKTGIVGVTLSRERSRAGTLTRRFSAVWPRVDGRGSHKRSFSVARWGAAEAFRRAVAAREAGLARLEEARRRRPLPARAR